MSPAGCNSKIYSSFVDITDAYVALCNNVR